MVLLALVDADYKFIYIDIGCSGRISDGGVYRNTTLSSVLENSSLNIPEAISHETLPQKEFINRAKNIWLSPK